MSKTLSTESIADKFLYALAKQDSKFKRDKAKEQTIWIHHFRNRKKFYFDIDVLNSVYGLLEGNGFIGISENESVAYNYDKSETEVLHHLRKAIIYKCWIVQKGRDFVFHKQHLDLDEKKENRRIWFERIVNGSISLVVSVISAILVLYFDKKDKPDSSNEEKVAPVNFENKDTSRVVHLIDTPISKGSVKK